ncbi:hypothetical protein BDW22DRAFT_1357483 [Trametopsis cervina]|nr:hypothetical protein BDW22DRAFT_1357483 [Trametopsis cervina]
MADVRTISHAGPSNLYQQPQEIIDVDALPDDAPLATTRRRSQQPHGRHSHRSSGASTSRQSQVIYILDSDDEDGAPRQRPFSGVPRPRIFSPPPPVVRRSIPPVPPVPRRFANQRHRSRSGHPPPIILPNDNPFPFEAQMNHFPPEPAAPVLPARGAPRSHHQPVMGLGGAIIALNRREEEDRQNARAQAPRHRGAFYPFAALAQSFRQFIGAIDEPVGHGPYADFGDLMQPPLEDDPWDAEWLPEAHYHGDAFGLPKRVPKAPAWYPSYTHPGQPDPGFSFDFEPKDTKPPSPTVIVLDDDDSPTRSTGQSGSDSSQETPTTLICARCMDPLTIAGQDSPELPPDEAKRRRVWALRCGHMLDGKCIDELMRPDGFPPIAEEAIAVTGSSRGNKGKGKGSAAMEVDVKGKGKALDRSMDMSLDDVTTGTVALGDTSMRSRLRPRATRSIASVANTDVSMASVDTNADSSRPTRPLPRRRGGTKATTSPARPKGKGRARKPTVEERHAWFCPVSTCCKEHSSIRMRDEEDWKMDDSLGAIAVFV